MTRTGNETVELEGKKRSPLPPRSLAGRLIIINIAWSCVRQRSSPCPVWLASRFEAMGLHVSRFSDKLIL
jgi:hypothetical protein